MTWAPCGPCKRAGVKSRCQDPDCAHRVTPATQELDIGAETPGLVGALYRLMGRCDYREVAAWLRGEIVRNTAEDFVLDAIAGMLGSIVLQVAGMRPRFQVRETGQRLMRDAVNLFERDVQVLLAPKSPLHNHLRAVPPPIETSSTVTYIDPRAGGREGDS